MVFVDVHMSSAECAAFRRIAREEGLSLSGWLRKAGLDRLAAAGAGRRFEGGVQLDAFFRECDARASGSEPDWEQHLQVMRSSRRQGQSDT